MDQNSNDIPTVTPSVARSWDGTWLLMVRCPWCTKLHTHGGGDGDQPGRFGARVSHCRDGNQGAYVITDPAEVAA
ncbi:hypothetical protein KBZ10_18020 [Streptomyces sp. F63]|uniref:hypothetical protein n=1 Tax=Streptomyces sp. F63 TaxID=2824887 RepID=UPI001B37D431|nr:hypothetical protein [Streptomyces sp. F63]MBQ0986373.1 hypothetical protein [Streptomyces sp. F63]